jgi:hypothetical protein
MILRQDLATVGSVTDPLGLGPICALNLANTVAYKMMFRNATDILQSTNPGGTVDTVNLSFASNTTIYNTINYIDTPLNQWLQTHQYDQYTNMTNLSGWSGSIVYTVANNFQGNTSWTPAANTAWQGNLAQSGTYAGLAMYLESVIAFYTGSYPNVVPLTIVGETGHDPRVGYSIPFSVIAQLIAQGPTITQATKPSGGTFAAQVYYPPVVLYFYNYDQPALIQIYQNNNLIADSTAAVVLTTDDKNLLTGPGGDGWFNDAPQYFLKDFQNTGGGYVTYAGKITFNYNPTNGNQFTVKVISPQSIRWRYVIAYPIDGASAGCVPPQQFFNVAPTFQAQYTNFAMSMWCGNGGTFSGSVSLLTGVTEAWTPIATPTPTTSVIPFDVAADWYGSVGGGQA